MFCKIRKGKTSYSIYICERYRKNGKVMSNDRKIVTYGYHSLYDDFEDYKPNFDKLPSFLEKVLTRKILKTYTIELYDDVESKLLKLKREYYPTYEKWCREFDFKYIKEQDQREEDYKEFKEKYKDLLYRELSAKYQEGYLSGQLANLNFSSSKSLDIDSQEKTLLKEAFKLLSHKHHPDKGGSTDTMVAINNLKEKIL